MEIGIAAVENLTLIRKPFKLDAIYFITPTIESLKLLFQDFNDILNPQYKCAHLIFCNNISDLNMNRIK
jgi:syntaxin-binding protein 1